MEPGIHFPFDKLGLIEVSEPSGGRHELQQQPMSQFSEVIEGRLHINNYLEGLSTLAGVFEELDRHLPNIWRLVVQLSEEKPQRPYVCLLATENKLPQLLSRIQSDVLKNSGNFDSVNRMRT
jgi:hypothetical protein